MVERLMGILARTAGVLLLVTAGELVPGGAVVTNLTVTNLTGELTAQADPVASTMSQQEDRRLANGQFVRDGDRSGKGQLAINNNGSHDAVVTLTRNRNAVYSVYVRQGMQSTVMGIPGGNANVSNVNPTDYPSP